MTATTLLPVGFDPQKATRAEFERLNDLMNRIHAEATPEDLPTSVDQRVMELKNTPPVLDVTTWVVWGDDGVAFACSDVGVPRLETNQHVAQCSVSVLPELRRQGLGARLLTEILVIAKSEKRNLLVFPTQSNVPAGEEFARAIGARVGLASHLNQLQIADLNRDLLSAWLERAQERASNFEIGVWEGPYPDTELAAVVQMKESANSMPTDDLDIEDFHWTEEQLRAMDEAGVARGDYRWSMHVKDRSNGAIVGYTEMVFSRDKPDLALQMDTAVFPEYQNRGIGRWLKAAMLQKLIDERPQIKRVRTGNAHSNAPMLRINNQLGFKPLRTEILWQVSVEDAEAYLRRRKANEEAG
jgi:GNAT superfamily N-acetyltransferase